MNEINFIFRLLKRIFIIGLLVGGGWLYFNDARVQATANQTAWNVRDRIAKLIGKDDTNSNDNSNLHLNDANNSSSKNEQEQRQNNKRVHKLRFRLLDDGRLIKQRFM